MNGIPAMKNSDALRIFSPEFFDLLRQVTNKEKWSFKTGDKEKWSFKTGDKEKWSFKTGDKQRKVVF
jgi:hypothetical protein